MGYIAQSINQTTTYTPTFTGFSVNPTNPVAVCSQNGKLGFFTILTNNPGTSNATTFTVTLPYVSARFGQRILGVAYDNGSFTTAPCELVTRSGSNIADVYLTLAGGGWTAGSTQKGVFITGTYETT
jgi:hypothetical protein